MTGPALSRVEMAVFAGCVAHVRSCFSPITREAWWRAPAPFRGGREAFARHLRRLDEAGVLHRLMGETARYVLTIAGEDLAQSIAEAMGEQVIRVSIVPGDQREALRRERDELRAEVERLTRERDGWRDERTRTASGLPLYVPVLTAPDETGARDVDHFRLATSEDIEALAEVERLRARWDALTSAPAVEAGAEAMLEVPLEDDDWGVVANAAIRAAMQAAQTTTQED